MGFAILTFGDDDGNLRDEMFALTFDDDEDEEDQPLFPDEDEEDEQDDEQDDELDRITSPDEILLAGRVIAGARYILSAPEDDVMIEYVDPEHPGLVVQVHVAARYGTPAQETPPTEPDAQA